MDATDLIRFNGLEQRALLPAPQMCFDESVGARPKKDCSLFPLATDPDRSPAEIYILYSNPHEFSDATSRRVKQFDHRLVADATRRVNQPTDIRCGDHAGKHLAHSLPSPNESRGDTIHNATHIKKIEEPPQRIEMPVVAIDGQVAVHNVDQKIPHVHVGRGAHVPISEEMTEGKGHLGIRLMCGTRETLSDNPFAEFLSQFGICTIGYGKQRAQ